MGHSMRTAEPANATTANATTMDPRWPFVVARDASMEDEFYYSVETTGVYCRPSCGARLAKPENVRFHRTCSDAERAGFRPCKRCKPNQPSLAEQNVSKIAAACRMMETAEERPNLLELATLAGLSRFHFHRIFKRVTGLTPNEYASACRTGRVRTNLVSRQSITEAIYDAGFNASSRFYATSDKVLGMTPTQFRAGGTNTDIAYAIGNCSLGSILVAWSQRGVCSISLGDDPVALVRDLEKRFPQSHLTSHPRDGADRVAKAIRLVEKPSFGLDLPLDIRGTAFQQRVWKALQQVPAGSTASYSEIARRIGKPKAVRAVAQACAANALAVAIPCHRAVRADGTLSGYRWGTERKQALLNREKQR